MPHSDSHSLAAVNGSVDRFEDPSMTSQEKDNVLAADKAFATERLQRLVADNALRPAQEYGNTTTAQARRRMEEMLKGFEEGFNKIN